MTVSDQTWWWLNQIGFCKFQQDARDEHRRNIDRMNASFNKGMAQAQKYKQSQKPPFTVRV